MHHCTACSAGERTMAQSAARPSHQPLRLDGSILCCADGATIQQACGLSDGLGGVLCSGQHLRVGG